MSKVPCSGSGSQNPPVDVLAGVLRLVSERHRLSSCALVNRNWRQAANSATTNVIIGGTVDLQQGIHSLSAWLRSNIYANEITQILVQPRDSNSSSPRPVLQLPCSKLRHLRTLKLPRCHLILDAGASSSAAAASTSAVAAPAAPPAPPVPRPLAALTALRRLELNNTLLDLNELGCCTGLQHLGLDCVKHISASSTSSGSKAEPVPWRENNAAWAPALASALPQLTQLTHLSLQCCHFRHPEEQDVPAISLHAARLSSLQQLQQLHLTMDKLKTVCLADLPTSLTLLHMNEPPTLNPTTAPGIMQLAQLQHLHITGGLDFSPLVLSTLTSLTWLCLESVLLKCDAVVPEDNAAEHLMIALQQLTELQHLSLYDSLMCADPPAHVEMYSALLASSQLTSLDVSSCWWGPHASLYVFAATDTPSFLRYITADAGLFSSAGSFQALAACCPELQQLVIVEGSEDNTLQRDIDLQSLSALSSLTALTKLEFTDVELSDDALQDIAACTQLVDLSLGANDNDPNYRVTLHGMMQLTQLTRLTHIDLCAISSEYINRYNRAPAGSPPDVHEQLQFAINLQLDPFEDDDTDQYEMIFPDDTGGDDASDEDLSDDN